MKKQLLILIIFLTVKIFPSENVLVNQAGYLPRLAKTVFVTVAADSFFVIEASTQNLFFKGALQLSTLKDNATGKIFYSGDFSSLTRPGRYLIKISNSDSSYKFLIADTVFEDVFSKSLKGFYFQRCGSILISQYAGKYERNKCHALDGWLHSSTGQTGFVYSPGGWHDAGDFGKYIVNAGVTVGTMLMAYELFPSGLCNDKLNIPESGNKIPDILDEIKYELDWMFSMQNSNGGVYAKLTREQFEGFIMPSQDTEKRYIYTISSTATGDFAAVMAKAARIYKQFDTAYAARCLSAAVNAWSYLLANPYIVPTGGFKNPTGTATGEYGDGDDKDERLWAAAELFFATGSDNYNSYFSTNYTAKGLFKSSMNWANVQSMALLTYLNGINPKASVTIKDHLSAALNIYCQNQLVTRSQNGTKVCIKPGEYNWGSNSEVLNRAILLIISYTRNNNKEYFNAALDQLNYILGVNGKNTSYVTGVGTLYPMFPHHRPSGSDGVKEPVPGLLAGGPDQYLDDAVLKSKYNSSTPPALCYIDDQGSYASNEIAINWNAPLVFVAGYFNAEGKTTNVKDNGSLMPDEIILEQNYPNPFNPETTINWQLKKEEKVSLKVYDILGREVKVLVDDVKPAGYYSTRIDFEKNNSGSKLSSGVYYYRLNTAAQTYTKKMLYLK